VAEFLGSSEVTRNGGVEGPIRVTLGWELAKRRSSRTGIILTVLRKKREGGLLMQWEQEARSELTVVLDEFHQFRLFLVHGLRVLDDSCVTEREKGSKIAKSQHLESTNTEVGYVLSAEMKLKYLQ
jgi:hypothetical protein